MNNKINIAELLKDCPKGMKLYSTIFGEVELKEVKDNGRSVCIFVTNFYGQEEMFYPDGKYNTHYSDSECALFPSKEQRDWGKFCPFKNGDVLSGKNGSVFIFNSRKFLKCINNYAYTSHCLFVPLSPLYVNPGGYRHTEKAVSFATKEEKEKLFRAIKDNGYKWNADTKTLEKLEKKDKFDITTLKPFDKVLVRDANNDLWMAANFSHYTKDAEWDCPYFASASCFKQCVPYEGNEHLLGTTNDCDEHYKTWKDETDE